MTYSKFIDFIQKFIDFIPKPKILFEKSLCKPPNIENEPYLLCMQFVEVAGGVCGPEECAGSAVCSISVKIGEIPILNSRKSIKKLEH